MTPDPSRAAPSLRELANRRYQDEAWGPIALRPGAVSTTRHDDIARLMTDQRGRALDFGCGAGQFVIALADRFDAVVGVDISDVRIRLADSVLTQRYSQYRDRVTFLCIDPAAPLPLPDRSFDVVIASAVLEAVPDVFFTLDELARVCRPGGSLLVSVANVCYIKHVLEMLAGQIPVTWSATRDMGQWRAHGWDGGCLRYFSQRALRDLLRHTGFEPEQWSGSGSFAKLRRWHPNLCGALTVRARRVARESS